MVETEKEKNHPIHMTYIQDVLNTYLNLCQSVNNKIRPIEEKVISFDSHLLCAEHWHDINIRTSTLYLKKFTRRK